MACAHILPSSVWGSKGHVASTATSSASPSGVGGRGRAPSGAHLIVISAGGGHGATSPPAGGHAVEATVTTTPAAAHGEPPHGPAAAPPLFKHHSEATVVVCLIVEVGVIRLGTPLNGSLANNDKVRHRTGSSN